MKNISYLIVTAMIFGATITSCDRNDDKPINFIVTFNSNDGSEVVQQTVVESEKATEPFPTPTKKGNKFDNWYTDNNTFKNKWDFTNQIVTKDIILHAKWITDATVFIEGIYFGTFTVEYPVDIMREGWNNSGTVTLELKDGKYTYTSDMPPKSCSGTYSINNDKIIFYRDRGAEYPDLYIVPPYFDINLWLNGEYDYTFDGEKLKFSATKDYAGTGKVGYYEYGFE